MTAASSAAPLRQVGIVLAVLGVFSLIAPIVTGVAVSLLVGIALLVAGLTKIVRVARSGSWKEHLEDSLLGGVASLGGLIMIARPLLFLAAITLVLLIYFVASGLLLIAWWRRLRPMPGSGSILVTGVATLLLALLVGLEWPLSGRWAVGTLVGVHLVLYGGSLIAIASAVKSGSRTETAD